MDSFRNSGVSHTVKRVLAQGRIIYAIAIIALGIATMVYARSGEFLASSTLRVVPVIPWVPAIPFVAALFGAIWLACGLALFSARTVRPAAMTLGSALFLCALIFDAAASITLSGHTAHLETLSLASLAWIFPDAPAATQLPARIGSYVLALCLSVFGVDHFLALQFIATLIPAWIPMHLFWAAFFGAAFVAAGLSIGTGYAQRLGAVLLGLMFGVWVVTLHLPRVLGIYAIPGAPRDPNEWSSLFIAVALCGGSWALAGNVSTRPLPA